MSENKNTVSKVYIFSNTSLQCTKNTGTVKYVEGMRFLKSMIEATITMYKDGNLLLTLNILNNLRAIQSSAI